MLAGGTGGIGRGASASWYVIPGLGGGPGGPGCELGAGGGGRRGGGSWWRGGGIGPIDFAPGGRR